MPVEPVISPQDDAPLTLTTLGHFALVGPAATQLLGPGKPLALLAYLACSPGRTASREHLIDLLWADSDPDRARHALRQSLWQIRHALGEGCLTGREEVALGCDLRVDRNRFLHAIESGDLETALAVYRGAFLAAFAAPGGAGFEHWADAEREGLEAAFHRAAELHARRLLAGGKAREVVALARRVIEAEPHGQAGRRLLIEAHLAAGDTISAVAEAEALRRWAEGEEMDLEPASQAWIDRVQRRTPDPVDLATSPGGTPGSLAADLVGRETEFAAILAAWGAARGGAFRHLHLVAPAGLGKTRLLLDTEARLRSTGARVRYVRAHPGDRDLPGALASEVARALATLPGAKGIAPEVAASLVALDPSLANSYHVPADAATGPEADRRRILAITELVRATADEGPHALLIDDVHWGDQSSIDLLSAVLSRLAGERVLIVSATRPTGDRQLRSEDRTTLHLAPLTAEHLGVLLDSIASFTSADQRGVVTAQLHRATGGNPLHVLELLALASERGALTVADGAWHLVADPTGAPLFIGGDGIRQRVARLGPTSHRVLALLALAGTPLDDEILAGASALDRSELDTQLIVLERLGFVRATAGGWEPAHDEIAEVASEVSDQEAGELRHAVGAALGTLGDGSAATFGRAARHLAALGDAPGIARLVVKVREDARRRGERPELSRVLAYLLGSTPDPSLEQRVRAALPLAMRIPRRPLAAAAALLLVVAAAVGWTRHEASVVAARSSRFEVVWESAGPNPVLAATLTIDRARWDPESPLQLTATRAWPHRWANPMMAGSYSPGGDSLAIPSMADADLSGSQDILLIDEAGEHLPSPAPHDDVDPTWTVDGRGLLFMTTRWSSAVTQELQVAHLDLTTGSLRQVAPSLDYDAHARQTLDGTGIVFTRRPRSTGVPAVCHVHFDGAAQRCTTFPSLRGLEVVGFDAAGNLLAIAVEPTSRWIGRIDPDTHLLTKLRGEHAQWFAVDPPGEYLLCSCTDPATGVERLLLTSTSQPTRQRWLDNPGEAAVIAIRAAGGSAAPLPLDSLEIAAPSSVIVGWPHALRLRGFDRRGTPMRFDTTTVRWRVDSGPATIDSLTGTLLASDTGTVVVTASAGGWRQASAGLRIAPVSSRLLLDESWDPTSLSARWRAFGYPPAILDSTTDRGRVLRTNGDATFGSGVYSRRVWSADAGLTLEATAFVKAPGILHQNLGLAFGASGDSSALGSWDHVTNAPPGVTVRALGTCRMDYPTTESAARRSKLVVGSGRQASEVRVDPALAHGRPHVWRVTVFPDGRCGVAIDSVPLFLSTPLVDLKRPLRAWIDGYSVATDIAVGRLRIWQGDPGGVDWGALDRSVGPDSAGGSR